MSHIDRRAFLKLTAAGAAAVALPWTIGARCLVPAFFTPAERATLGAVVDTMVPGALGAGAVAYVERLLAAFDVDPPAIFAGGPFSGRTPFPDPETGAPSGRFPSDNFSAWLPVPRVKESAWRVRLYGSASVPGWRDVYRSGLRAIDAKANDGFGRAFADLRPDEQASLLAGADGAFLSLVTEHAVEGMYAAPEYGGNRRLSGWRAISYAGDSQPLGYSIFDELHGGYRELDAAPVSRANPGDTPGFSAETLEFVSAIVAGAGGRRFY